VECEIQNWREKEGFQRRKGLKKEKEGGVGGLLLKRNEEKSKVSPREFWGGEGPKAQGFRRAYSANKSEGRFRDAACLSKCEEGGQKLSWKEAETGRSHFTQAGEKKKTGEEEKTERFSGHMEILIRTNLRD